MAQIRSVDVVLETPKRSFTGPIAREMSSSCRAIKLRWFLGPDYLLIFVGIQPPWDGKKWYFKPLSILKPWDVLLVLCRMLSCQLELQQPTYSDRLIVSVSANRWALNGYCGNCQVCLSFSPKDDNRSLSALESPLIRPMILQITITVQAPMLMTLTTKGLQRAVRSWPYYLLHLCRACWRALCRPSSITFFYGQQCSLSSSKSWKSVAMLMISEDATIRIWDLETSLSDALKWRSYFQKSKRFMEGTTT